MPRVGKTGPGKHGTCYKCLSTARHLEYFDEAGKFELRVCFCPGCGSAWSPGSLLVYPKYISEPSEMRALESLRGHIASSEHDLALVRLLRVCVSANWHMRPLVADYARGWIVRIEDRMEAELDAGGDHAISLEG